MNNSIEFIVPDWPAPGHVHAVSTTRAGGTSQPPWDSLNLGDHVSDNPADVVENRRLLMRCAALPNEPVWLEQVHGRKIADSSSLRVADGRYASRPGEVCAVLTADCLPVLFCDLEGEAVAAAHAGWRGLAVGVLEAAVEKFEVSPGHVMAWMGPAIGPGAFEVGAEVRRAFTGHDPRAADAFQQIGNGRWLADIYQLARQRLQAMGVDSIYGGGYCTVSDQQRFFSYRRDGVTGRMASMIWIQEK